MRLAKTKQETEVLHHLIQSNQLRATTTKNDESERKTENNERVNQSIEKKKSTIYFIYLTYLVLD